MLARRDARVMHVCVSCRLERERRHAEQETKARDVRLQRALEEVERYKAMLGELKSQVHTDTHTHKHTQTHTNVHT